MSDLSQYELDEIKEDQENTLETHEINGRIFVDLDIYQSLQVDSLSTIERLSAKVAELEQLSELQRESEWVSVDERKPKQGDRVLLTTKDEICPVVGYWGCGEWEACTVNFKDDCISCLVDQNFTSDDVTHWKPITPPKEG